MSVVTVSATVEASNTPPRVRLNVTDIGSPNIFAATVTRLDPDGRVVPVRTGDGNPLTLTTSGSNRVGILYDYEMPYGQPVSYSTQESPTTTSGEVVVPEARAWLVHPGVPELSMPIELRVGSMAEEEWGVDQQVHRPMGRRHPLVVNTGVRFAPSSSLIVGISSMTELDRMEAMVSDAGTLLLNVPPSLGLGIDTDYIAVGVIRNARPSDIGADPHRDIVMPFFVVERPAGGSQAARTYADLLVYPTYTALRVAYPTYLDLLGGP